MLQIKKKTHTKLYLNDIMTNILVKTAALLFNVYNRKFFENVHNIF